MNVRNKKSLNIDDLQFVASRGAILHPDTNVRFLDLLHELERKGKLCRVPSTILETYHLEMPKRVATFKESCRQRAIVLSS
jgi:hypothetical protein